MIDSEKRIPANTLITYKEKVMKIEKHKRPTMRQKQNVDCYMLYIKIIIKWCSITRESPVASLYNISYRKLGYVILKIELLVDIKTKEVVC